VAADTKNSPKLSWKEKRAYNQYKTKDAEKAAFIKKGVPDKIIEGAAQENLNNATNELNEVNSRMADLQTEKNKAAARQDSQAISRITAEIKELENQQADSALGEWKADWQINEKNKIAEDKAKAEKTRTLAEAEFLKNGAEYSEGGEGLNLTNEEIEAARTEMTANLEKQGKIESVPSLLPKEMAAMQKERKILEAGLLEGGAKYIINEKGEKQLILTPEQIQKSQDEMERALENTEEIKSSQEGNHNFAETKTEAKNAPDNTAENIREIDKKRILSDGELLQDNAKYEVSKEGKIVGLNITEKQYEKIHKEMENASHGTNKTEADKNSEKISKVTQTATKENVAHGNATAAEGEKAGKKELPNWLKILFEAAGELLFAGWAYLFGLLEKQFDKKKK
jgi:hypothetical protein